MKRRLLPLAIVPLLVLGLIVYIVKTKLADAQKDKPIVAAGPRDAIVAQARLEPENGIVYVGAPLDSILARMNVKEGQYLKAGDPIADLTTHDLRSSEREAAALRIARAQLGALGAEAQAGQIKTMEIDSAEAERERQRRKDLVAKGAISAAEVENADSRVARVESEKERARTMLSQMKQNTNIEQKEAIRALAVADALLDQTVIRAPADGEILRVVAHPGERPGAMGVVVMGDTHKMTAVVEVHANDVRLVQVGHHAKFTSPALTEPIPGKVVRIGKMIYKNNVFGEDQNAPENLRVFQVRVLLDSSEVAGRYTNLEGQVRIDITSPPAPPSSAAPPGSAGRP